MPEDVRQYLDVARRLHGYGYFEYQFFTVAHERATFASEFAVRRRFIEHYAGLVPIVCKDEFTEFLEASDCWAFDSLFRAKYPRGWRLQAHPSFNGSFKALLDWSRSTIALGVYFEGGRLDALLALRNLAAHPGGDTIIGPPDSSRSIEFVWEFIDALWGRPAEETREAWIDIR